MLELQSQTIDQVEEHLATFSEQEWLDRGGIKTLELFHEMAERVPAYADFLDKHGVDPHNVRSIKDLNLVPAIDKDNYLRSYPREKLCWDGKFASARWVISSTSGSTGQPYYFPRTTTQDDAYALTAELYLRSNFSIHTKSTLYIDAFAMGVWIGGLFTYEAIRRVAEKGQYSLSVITPGINKQEVVNAVKNLGKDFDQIIIGCYPPILKDILDDGILSGLNWSEYQMGFVFSAEGFTETFRDYVVETAGLQNVLTDTLNHYGTVDLGTMAHETPISILARRLALTNDKLFVDIFKEAHKVPTFAQYIPEMFFFEEEKGSLYCSSESGLPLLKYDLKDHGGIVTFSELEACFKRAGLDLMAEARKAGIEHTVSKLPFVHVYERSDFSVTFLGFQVYPEPIRKVLHLKEFTAAVTGKFTLAVDYDAENEQRLMVHVELKADQHESKELVAALTPLVVHQLVRENPIYKMNHETFGERVYPQIVLWPYEDKTYFGAGGKQKWVKK